MILTHDETGYPLNYDPSTFYQEDESFFHLPNRVLDVEQYGSYMISNWGRLYNINTGNYIPDILTPLENNYIRVLLKLSNGEWIRVAMHRIVALTFYPIEDPQNYVVNHKDGVKWHNEPYNLEWVTTKENIQHAIQTGLSIREGENNPYAALTNDQYNMICKLTQEGYFPAQINDIMNLQIDITNIAQKIRQGSSGNYIASSYDFSNIPRNHYRKFSEQEVRVICQMFQDKVQLSPKEMLRVLGYDVDNMDPALLKKYRDTISTIKRKVSYIEIGKDYNF